MDKKAVIFYENGGQPERLDQFLLRKFPEYSRAYFQRLIADGQVRVILQSGADRVVNKGYRLKPMDKIEVVFPEAKKFSVEPQEIPFGIVDKNDDFLIINKPAGLTVHHTKEHSHEPTLVSGLLYRFDELAALDAKGGRPGIVHRIDKLTSGLLVVALTTESHIELSRLFKERKVEKTYLAVVCGHPPQEGSIDFPIGRHPVERTKMSHVSYASRPALTHYKVLQYYKKSQAHPECALVAARLVTGRTHQIRVHFAALGHGLLGDTVYGVSSKLIGRQALHAWRLSFEFKGKHFDYVAPVPEDFKLLLSHLKRERICLTPPRNAL